MGCDMMLAFGATTAQRQSLLGINFFDAGRQRPLVRSFPAASHPLDAAIQTSDIRLPQTRQTCAVLGVQAPDSWGLPFGCNEHRVAIGTAGWRSRMPATEPGPSGNDLTRLGLERSHSALHAVEVITDLIARHGQCNPTETAPDSLFLIADANEAFLLEVAGRCWALLECAHTRAVADVGMIRQDWKRLSPGLSEQAIQNGWWNDNGTKLDFGGILGSTDNDAAWGLKRWSRATLALAQQQGSLDAPAMRPLLADQFDTCVRRHALAPRAVRHLASLIVRLDGPGGPIVWFARGPVETPLYFPLVVGAEIPAHFCDAALVEQGAASRSLVERLQSQFDREAEEYLVEAQQLHERGELTARLRLAQAMMQRHVEHYEAGDYRRLDQPVAGVPRPARDEEEMASYAFG